MMIHMEWNDTLYWLKRESVWSLFNMRLVNTINMKVDKPQGAKEKRKKEKRCTCVFEIIPKRSESPKPFAFTSSTSNVPIAISVSPLLFSLDEVQFHQNSKKRLSAWLLHGLYTIEDLQWVVEKPTGGQDIGMKKGRLANIWILPPIDQRYETSTARHVWLGKINREKRKE